jgi:hypothetical protein
MLAMGKLLYNFVCQSDNGNTQCQLLRGRRSTSVAMALSFQRMTNYEEWAISSRRENDPIKADAGLTCKGRRHRND